MQPNFVSFCIVFHFEILQNHPFSWGSEFLRFCLSAEPHMLKVYLYKIQVLSICRHFVFQWINLLSAKYCSI